MVESNFFNGGRKGGGEGVGSVGGATVASKKKGQETALAKSRTNVSLPLQRVTVQRTFLAPKTVTTATLEYGCCYATRTEFAKHLLHRKPTGPNLSVRRHRVVSSTFLQN